MRSVFAILFLLWSLPASAQTGYDDSFRLIARDAFTLLQTEIGTQRFRLDESARQKGQGGITAIESVKIAVSSPDPATWEAAVRKQLQAKVKALALKVSTASLIGSPNGATSKPDTVWMSDPLRGIVLQVKHGEPGLSGRRSLTLAVLVGR